MNDDEFKDLAVQAGFEMALCGDGKERLASPIDHDIVQNELFALKNLLLDKIEEEVRSLPVLTGSYSDAISFVMQILTAMR